MLYWYRGWKPNQATLIPFTRIRLLDNNYLVDMGLSWVVFAIFLQLTADILCVGVNGIKGKINRKKPNTQLRAAKFSILRKPYVVCYCNYLNYLKLKSRNLLRRGYVVKIKKKHTITPKTFRDVIYAPTCCKVDLSDPNKLHRYPLTIRLPDKVFSENLNDPSSLEYQNLTSEIIQSIGELFAGDSPFISTDVTTFKPGSVIAELVITVKGMLSQTMYDTLKMAIESGKIGELTVAVVPVEENPTAQENTNPNTETTPTNSENPESGTTTPQEGPVTPQTEPSSPTDEATTLPQKPPTENAGAEGTTNPNGETTPTNAGSETPESGTTTPPITEPTSPTEEETTPQAGNQKPPTEIGGSEGNTNTNTTTPTNTGSITPESGATTPPEGSITPETGPTSPTEETTSQAGNQKPPTGNTTTPTNTGSITPESGTTTPPEGSITPETEPTSPTGEETTPQAGNQKPPTENTGAEGTTNPNGEATPTNAGSETPESGATTPPETEPTSPTEEETTPQAGNQKPPTENTPAEGTKPDTGTTTPETEGTNPILPNPDTAPTETTAEPGDLSGTQGSETVASFEKQCLCAHNQKRNAHGTPVMTWSTVIAESAQAWANKMAASDEMKHDPSNSLYGENLYMEWGSHKRSNNGICRTAIDSWYDEIKNYDFNKPGFSAGTGHFTQVVWKASIILGVGKATSASGKRYVVARYKPRGNMLGDFEANVPPPVAGIPAGPSNECAVEEKPTEQGGPTELTPVNLPNENEYPETVPPNPVQIAPSPTIGVIPPDAGGVTPNVPVAPNEVVPSTTGLTPMPIVPGVVNPNAQNVNPTPVAEGIAISTAGVPTTSENTPAAGIKPDTGTTTPETEGTNPILPNPDTATTETTSEPGDLSGTQGSETGATFGKECLCAHNQKRNAHGTPVMTWSAEITESAQAWANEMAASDKMKHDLSNSLYGENLYMQWSSLKRSNKGICKTAVDKWYNEITDYDFNNPGFSAGTGHFTQVVWKESIILGVGEATSASGKRYVVARYKPRGNMMGNFEANVPRPLSGIPADPSDECAVGVEERPTEQGGPTEVTPAILPSENNIPKPVPLTPVQIAPSPTIGVIPPAGGVTPNVPVEPNEVVNPEPIPLTPVQIAPSPTIGVITPAGGVTPNVPVEPNEVVNPEPIPLTPVQIAPSPTIDVIPPDTGGVTPNVPDEPNEVVPSTIGLTPMPIVPGVVNPNAQNVNPTPVAEGMAISTAGVPTTFPETLAPKPFPIEPSVVPIPIISGTPLLPALTETAIPIPLETNIYPQPVSSKPIPVSSVELPSAGEKPSEPIESRPTTPYDSTLAARLFAAVIKLVDEIFSKELSNPASSLYQQLKITIEQAMRTIFEDNPSFLSATVKNFRPSVANNVNKKLNNLLRRTAGAPGVDAQTEIEFRENKPDQLKPLENAVSTGRLGGHRVLPVISAVIVETGMNQVCPTICLPPTICPPQCPTKCCPSTTATSCPHLCSNTCAPACRFSCCKLAKKPAIHPWH